MQGDSVGAVAAFLLDATRGEVSARTVVLVLQHWVDEGLSRAEIAQAVESADGACPPRHRPLLDGYRHAITTQFLRPESR